MNSIEQIWKEIRKIGFKNEVFQTLQKVFDRLCDTICSLSNETIKSITGRDWISSNIIVDYYNSLNENKKGAVKKSLFVFPHSFVVFIRQIETSAQRLINICQKASKKMKNSYKS